MFKVSEFLAFVQSNLFPHVEEHLGPLTETEKNLLKILEFLQIETYVRDLPTGYRGQQPLSRKPIARAFVAKAVLGIDKTSTLIERIRTSPNLRKICGWDHARDIPSEATFSRAFADFAKSSLPAKVHQELIQECYRWTIVGHISRDSTAIHAREKATNKPPKQEKPKRKRGRPKKDDPVAPKPPTRLQEQQTESLHEMVQKLPVVCDWSSKMNSQGKIESWKGYKLHLDVADGGVIINAIQTSASVHDSQVAIPLMVGTSNRVNYLYDLMDAGYDAREIRAYSESLGHVPIIDSNPRRGEKREMAPAEKARYGERSTVERSNGRLKDEFIGRQMWLRGPTKVFAHLMFGVLCLTVDALFRLVA
jgi:hypothetical protein